MVDNFALLVSQLMMLIVLWRAFTLPEVEGEADQVRRKFGPRKRGRGKDGED